MYPQLSHTFDIWVGIFPNYKLCDNIFGTIGEEEFESFMIQEQHLASLSRSLYL
jgi:hypothetical protein